MQGRKGIWEKLRSGVGSWEPGVNSRKEKVIWVHCASLGEFEQGRPVIENLRSQYPDSRLILTFFSPSGYEIRKDYKGADMVFYLPMDGPQNAKRFIKLVNPSLVIFVKYEFWYYYLKELKQNNIPLLLISAIFRENSIFFKWYGDFHRKMLSFFDHLFVQNESSKKLLAGIHLDNITSVCGDTRFDRVIEIAEQFTTIPVIEKFVGNNKTIVAGSTWPEDEQVLQKSITEINDPSLKLIIAPHEIGKEHISQLQKLFPGSTLFSALTSDNKQASTNIEFPVTSPSSGSGQQPATGNILIIDNIGMLSRLYKYGYITYIGGGFGKGIHNTLEAAVYGKPVLFGPAYHKFQEAIDLAGTGGAISINNSEECVAAVQKLITDNVVYRSSCEKAKDYVYTNKGATKKIMQYIQEKRLLTN